MTTQTKTIVFVTIITLLGALNISAQTLPDSDFQVLHETTVTVPLVKGTDEKGKSIDKLSLVVLGTLRFGQNRMYPIDRRIGVGFDVRLNNNFTFSPSYYYRHGEDLKNVKEIEHRARFDLTYGRKWKSFGIKDRNRVEYRIRNSRKDTVRYRNKFTFSVPVVRDGKEVFAPFVADEVYYDFTVNLFTRNEFTAGITRKLNKSVSAEFFYMLRHNRTRVLRTVNGVGVNLKIRID